LQEQYNKLKALNERVKNLLLENNINFNVPTPIKDDTDLNQRVKSMLIQEIIVTERDYVKDLDIIINVYYEPLKSLGIISEEEVHTLFSTVEDLYVLNRDKVLKRFEEIYSGATENGIPLWEIDLGDIFLELSEHLKSYADYCANQPSALNLLEGLQNENNDFDKFVTDIMDNNPVVRRLSLLSFIIKPVQRLCKYPLLLRELIRMTTPDSDEYHKINQAAEKVGITVGVVNEMQREAELKRQQELEHIAAIEDSIEGSDVFGLADDKNRKLIGQGPIERLVKKKKKNQDIFGCLIIFC